MLCSSARSNNPKGDIMKCSAVFLVPSFLILSIFLASPQPALAATYVRVADEHLADQAAVIAEVRVLAADPSPGAARPVTDYLVEVVDLIAGYAPSSSIVVRVPGGHLDGMENRVFGAPRFGEGQPALLFLAPSPDGTYRILHLMLGAFALDEVGGRRVAYRHLEDAVELVPPGVEAPGPEKPRDLERFRAWLAERAQGLKRPADYRIDPPAAGMPDPLEKYSLLRASDGVPGRWREFDTGGNVRFRAHSSGQSGQPGGGFSQFQTALRAWTNHPHTPIRYLYGNTTTASGGLSSTDGVNAILFGDPNGYSGFEGPFNCSDGGILAFGGWRSRSGHHTHRGETYWTIDEGDIVTNEGIECTLPGNDLLEELFAHELGHTLGLGHSSSSGALMWPYIHGDGRGARLSSDDKNGIIFLYGDPPAAPSGLEAETRDDGIRLSWRDNADDESGFEVWRRTGSSGYSRVRSVSANTTAWLDDGGSTGRTYTYRVRAINAAGASAYTDEASATMPGVPAPSNLLASGLSSSEIQLTWEDNSEDETELQVQGKTGEASFALIATVPADTEMLVVGSLASETTYTFRVRAVTPIGNSGYSNQASATTFGQPCECVEGPTTMCLDGGRFRVEVDWRDHIDQIGDAKVVDFGSNNSGLLWFFNPENWEMLIKVLDGCGINDRYWVFSAATTDVEYNLEVTDCWVGATSVYSNPLGTASPAITDTDAFASCSAPPPAGLALRGPGEQSAGLVRSATAGGSGFEKQGDCVSSDTEMCLDHNRFKVELEWQDYDSNVGSGRVVATDSVNSGLLWFFNDSNWEVLIKVLDGCGINGHYWVFFAATTTVEFTLRVTDTETDTVMEYENALDHAADTVTDTSAFDTCP